MYSITANCMDAIELNIDLSEPTINIVAHTKNVEVVGNLTDTKIFYNREEQVVEITGIPNREEQIVEITGISTGMKKGD